MDFFNIENPYSTKLNANSKNPLKNTYPNYSNENKNFTLEEEDFNNIKSNPMSSSYFNFNDRNKVNKKYNINPFDSDEDENNYYENIKKAEDDIKKKNSSTNNFIEEKEKIERKKSNNENNNIINSDQDFKPDSEEDNNNIIKFNNKENEKTSSISSNFSISGKNSDSNNATESITNKNSDNKLIFLNTLHKNSENNGNNNLIQSFNKKLKRKKKNRKKVDEIKNKSNEKLIGKRYIVDNYFLGSKSCEKKKSDNSNNSLRNIDKSQDNDFSEDNKDNNILKSYNSKTTNIKNFQIKGKNNDNNKSESDNEEKNYFRNRNLNQTVGRKNLGTTGFSYPHYFNIIEKKPSNEKKNSNEEIRLTMPVSKTRSFYKDEKNKESEKDEQKEEDFKASFSRKVRLRKGKELEKNKIKNSRYDNNKTNTYNNVIEKNEKMNQTERNNNNLRNQKIKQLNNRNPVPVQKSLSSNNFNRTISNKKPNNIFQGKKEAPMDIRRNEENRNQRNLQRTPDKNLNTNKFRSFPEKAKPDLLKLGVGTSSSYIKSQYALTKEGVNEFGQFKINQDSFISFNNLNGIKDFNIFGVLDGHGPDGHFVSRFVSESIYSNLISHPEIIPLTNPEEIYQKLIQNNYKIFNELFLKAEFSLKNIKKFDVLESGTTAVIVIMVGKHVICANTGDSRAVLIYDKPNDRSLFEAEVFPLSIDHKPGLEKEKQRIFASGGKIEKMKVGYGITAGPYRVWVKDCDYPGLTMSRSIGDFKGKDKCGLIPDPEFTEYTLDDESKYMVICSDGVWEFLSSYDVMDIGKKYYDKKDANGCCKEILEKSLAQWQFEDCFTDDITIIVLFF